ADHFLYPQGSRPFSIFLFSSSRHPPFRLTRFVSVWDCKGRKTFLIRKKNIFIFPLFFSPLFQLIILNHLPSHFPFLPNRAAKVALYFLSPRTILK
ncbi:hypothetical protein, partial [Pedobacter rhizosphaerae]|uniref:hypothetical protein n=1 Tax=Pedobacter rhizosphaerae TaxID=390241 RepID=UPI001C31DDAD